MSNEPAPDTPPSGPRLGLEFKAALLMLSLVLLLVASALYLLYARGVFERTQRLVLVAEDAEGVAVGMDMTFSGFAIGRVARIELARDGKARILIDVPHKDAHWLRKSSVFTMERGVVGGPRIRAYSGILSDPPLEDGAERSVLSGDVAAEIPRLVGAARELVANLQALTAPDAALAQTLANVQAVTAAMSGPQGTVARANGLIARIDGLTARADTQVFGEQGVMKETRAAIVQLQTLLADARGSLQRVDAVLKDAQAIAANTREATTDLTALRAEVEGSLRKVDHLIGEVNRRWPFARDTEIKLP